MCLCEKVLLFHLLQHVDLEFGLCFKEPSSEKEVEHLDSDVSVTVSSLLLAHGS